LGRKRDIYNPESGDDVSEKTASTIRTVQGREVVKIDSKAFHNSSDRRQSAYTEDLEDRLISGNSHGNISD
jgi:hypothetical protein